MNIAIIIGVSVYSDSKNNLPGCKNDADAINNILLKSEKFNSILLINDSEKSAKVKELITNFIAQNKSSTIDEFFFYYSGHGEFFNDDFYYILSDYDSKRRNQSSLRNSEMDDLIRSVQPKLVVKVIDACQSGTAYIKESNVLDKYFNESKQTFNKCYFLNSSLNTQSSYQDKNISSFTKSFINALKVHDSNEIRYKDIIDVISDEFTDVQEQTPFFVIQADLTEKFCSFSKALREYLKTITFNNISTKSSTAPLSIFDLVKLDAKEYVDKEGALKALNLIQSTFSTLTLTPELGELYDIKVNFLENHAQIPRKDIISNWIYHNKSEYFAETIWSEIYDAEIGESYEVPVGFDLKIDSPFKAITVDAISKYPNLVSYHSTVVFLISKRLIRFFYFITDYIVDGWDDLKVNYQEIKWITDEYRIGNSSDILEGISDITNSIQNRMESDIKSKFKLENNTDIVDEDLVKDALAGHNNN